MVATETNFGTTKQAWGQTDGLPVLKGGTPNAITTIDSGILAKFAVRKAYTDAATPKEMGGAVSLTLKDGVGYAKFTAKQ